MSHYVLAYYAIVKIDDPQKEVAHHKDFLKSLDFRSRIYISKQGINGQASATVEDAQKYIEWLKKDPRFQQVDFKVDVASEHAFPKTTVKYRRQLVALDQEVDLSNRGESVSSQVWKEMLEKKGKETLLLDVRNDYEWKVGHFEGAELPKLEQFREFAAYAERLKDEKDPKETPVMMYCTGGIRCEIFSAVLKEKGFEKVYQLKGGIIQYGKDLRNDHWKGKLFVFDDRLVVPLGADGEPISHCAYCGTLNDVYYNCANTDCNNLFLCCLPCLRAHSGCCSDGCKTGRVRPFHENAKPFRKLSSLS